MNAYITNKISKNICLEPFLQKKKRELWVSSPLSNKEQKNEEGFSWNLVGEVVKHLEMLDKIEQNYF